MNIRQQDAAAPHAVKSTLRLISVSTVALMIGIGAAAAQPGNDARKPNRHIEKQKDDALLTPVRPLPRKVGDTSWPDPKPDAQREANERKNASQRETTGQAANPQPTTQNNNAPAQQQNNTAPNQQPAQSAPIPQNNTAQNQPTQNNPSAPNDHQASQQSHVKDDSHASIRLGTDAGGKVAINEDQERQLTAALRKARVKSADLDVAVQVGGAPPNTVRLAAVSSDIVEVLPQFRGYSYFATANDVYIVDPAAKRIVAFFPAKVTTTASRTASPESAQQTDATRPVASENRKSRKSRKAAPHGRDGLEGIEAAIDREMARRGIVVRNGSNTHKVVVEEAAPVQTYRVQRPWFLGSR